MAVLLRPSGLDHRTCDRLIAFSFIAYRRRRRRRRRCSRAVTSNVSAQVKKALIELNLGESVAHRVFGLLNTCDSMITQGKRT